MASHGSASQVSPRQLAELHAAVIRALPEMSADFAQKWIENPRGLAEALRTLALSEINSLTVTVDYSLTLVEMIKASGCSSVDPDITVEHFPFPFRGKKEKIELKITRVDFGRDIFTDEAKWLMRRHGFRPARIEVLLALAAQHPELLQKSPVVALGSKWRNEYGLNISPYLRGSSGNRQLELTCADNEWGDNCQFVVVCK